MNPYEILGVRKDATPKQIKNRHRKLTMKHHPDKGGDKKHFHMIQESYECLSDPERRKSFDETGSMGDRPVNNDLQNAYSTFFQVLMSIVQQIVSNGQDPHYHDLVQAVKDTVRNEIDVKIREKMEEAEKTIGVFESLMPSFTAKDGEEPFTSMIFRGAIGSQRQAIQALKDSKVKLETVHDLCNDVEFTTKVKMQTVFYTSTGTTSSGW